MSTLNQLIRKTKQKKYRSLRVPALDQNPQKKGLCLEVFVRTPRKPNSALRKVAKVLLSNSKKVLVYIPGEGHSLKKFSTVLLCGGFVKDLPGVKYKAIRGKYDLFGVRGRVTSRSKYGVKLLKK